MHKKPYDENWCWRLMGEKRESLSKQYRHLRPPEVTAQFVENQVYRYDEVAIHGDLLQWA